MNPDSDMPRVSLRDIAARLGVSHSTVSLSLRDHPRISQVMKDRVRRTAGEMGYRPDPMLAALANYRRGRENQAVREIHGRGYRRIGFVTLEGDFSKRGMQFELGFLGGQRLIRDEDPIPRLILGDSNAAERTGAFDGWLCRH